MNKELNYVSQLAAKRVLWNEHSQDSGIWTDLQSLVPFSVPMKVDLTPWLDWIEEHKIAFLSSRITAEMSIGEVLATSLDGWTDDWRQKMGYNAEQASIFMDEWKYVLTAPCFELYRTSTKGIEQLNKLACHIYAANEKHLVSAREEWAYDTMQLLPDVKVWQVAFLVWCEATPQTRQKLNPKWAQWYDLFGDPEGFMQCVRQDSMLCTETLPLPNEFHFDSPVSP